MKEKKKTKLGERELLPCRKLECKLFTNLFRGQDTDQKELRCPKKEQRISASEYLGTNYLGDYQGVHSRFFRCRQ